MLYSVTDRNSYNYVANMLNNIQRHDNYRSTTVIVVANKTDLVRNKQVADRGMSLSFYNTETLRTWDIGPRAYNLGYNL